MNPTKKSYPTKTAAAINNNNTCDPFTGLRIVDRRTSRANMVEAFSCLTYKSCSMLAAASRAEWNTNYLVDGGGGNGPPSGKTNLATCGILTGDTSSRLSKTGKAFAILSLGDLPSSMHASGSASSNSANKINASITVFLFGDALGVLRSNKKYMNSGWAVAVLGPNVMPPRDGDKNGGGATSITLSVCDPKQILPIGKAADVDRCKGTMKMRVKSDYGRASWEDVRCNTLIDLRLCGGYCQTHRRHGLSSSGNGGTNKSSNNNGNVTFMQRQRMQNIIPMNGGAGLQANARNKTLGQAPSHLGTGGRVAPSSLSEALAQSDLFEPAPTLAPASKTQFLKHAPLHMKQKPSYASKNANNVAAAANTRATKATNPYLTDKIGQRSQDFMSTKRKDQQDILGEALERKRLRSGNLQMSKKSTLKSGPNSKRPCRVLTTEGYDGAVQVPKPSAVLFKRRVGTLAAMATPSPTVNPHAILEKQRYMAGLLREEKGVIVGASAVVGKKKIVFNKDSLARSKQKILAKGGTKSLPTHSSRSESFRQINKVDDFASAFGDTSSSSGQSFDREAIFNAKSKFASAANAQEYARARSVLQDLEAREEGGTKRGKNSDRNSGKSKPTASIATTGWACRTCKKTTPFKPVSCIRSRHDVRQKRELKEGAKSLGTRKERLERHGKDSEEGGLILGAGVEWSGYERL